MLANTMCAGTSRAACLLFTTTLFFGLGPGCVEETSKTEVSQSADDIAPGGKADSVEVTEGPGPFDPELCAYDPTDPFEPHARLTKGPFEGDCLDTKTARPLAVLDTPDEDSSVLRVANFFHDDGYWLASIPTAAVTDVYFQLEYFPAVVPAGHTQLRVSFNEPIVLVGQSAWNEGEIDAIFDLVISADAVRRVSDRYDLVNGAKDHFGLVYEMTSLDATYDWMIVKQAHHVEQWRLQMTEREMRDLLPFYAYESETIGLGQTYHTLLRNCATEIVGTLDAVVDYTVGEQIKRFLVQFTEIYPNIVRTALIARGLLPLDQSTDWYALEDDPVYLAE